MNWDRCEWCRRVGVPIADNGPWGGNRLTCVDKKSCVATIDLQTDLQDAGERDDSECDVLVMRTRSRPGWSVAQP